MKPMDVLYLLIALGIAVLFIVIVSFIFTIKSGQYDDMEGPAHRILMDDDDPKIPRSHLAKKAEKRKL